MEIPWSFQGVERQPKFRYLDCQVRYSLAEVAKFMDGPSTNPPEFAVALKQDPTFVRLRDQSEQATYTEQQLREWNRQREDAHRRSFPSMTISCLVYSSCSPILMNTREKG